MHEKLVLIVTLFVLVIGLAFGSEPMSAQNACGPTNATIVSLPSPLPLLSAPSETAAAVGSYVVTGGSRWHVEEVGNAKWYKACNPSDAAADGYMLKVMAQLDPPAQTSSLEEWLQVPDVPVVNTCVELIAAAPRGQLIIPPGRSFVVCSELDPEGDGFPFTSWEGLGDPTVQPVVNFAEGLINDRNEVYDPDPPFTTTMWNGAMIANWTRRPECDLAYDEDGRWVESVVGDTFGNPGCFTVLEYDVTAEVSDEEGTTPVDDLPPRGVLAIQPGNVFYGPDGWDGLPVLIMYVDPTNTTAAGTLAQMAAGFSGVNVSEYTIVSVDDNPRPGYEQQTCDMPHGAPINARIDTNIAYFDDGCVVLMSFDQSHLMPAPPAGG